MIIESNSSLSSSALDSIALSDHSALSLRLFGIDLSPIKASMPRGKNASTLQNQEKQGEGEGEGEVDQEGKEDEEVKDEEGMDQDE